jgi:hypothetical protein
MSKSRTRGKWCSAGTLQDSHPDTLEQLVALDKKKGKKMEQTLRHPRTHTASMFLLFDGMCEYEFV